MKILFLFPSLKKKKGWNLVWSQQCVNTNSQAPIIHFRSWLYWGRKEASRMGRGWNRRVEEEGQQEQSTCKNATRNPVLCVLKTMNCKTRPFLQIKWYNLQLHVPCFCKLCSGNTANARWLCISSQVHSQQWGGGEVSYDRSKWHAGNRQMVHIGAPSIASLRLD